MAQIGNKQNSHLNGEWAAHVRKRHGSKRRTAKARRRDGKATIKNWHSNKHRARGR